VHLLDKRIQGAAKLTGRKYELFTIVLSLSLNFFSINFKLHGKDDFAERSEILLDTDLKIILLNYQNNYVEHSNWLIEYKILLQRCSLFSRFQQNCFVKILDLSAKPFFPSMHYN